MYKYLLIFVDKNTNYFYLCQIGCRKFTTDIYNFPINSFSNFKFNKILNQKNLECLGLKFIIKIAVCFYCSSKYLMPILVK